MAAYQSRLRAAVERREATEVFMNEEPKGVVFNHTPVIGTDGLGGCTVMTVITEISAAMGHVSPRKEPYQTYHEEGEDHVKLFMERFTTFLDRWSPYFPKGSTAWIICASMGGSVALADQVALIKRRLEKAGMRVGSENVLTYEVPYDANHPDRGSVVVDSRSGNIELYVEHRLAHTIYRVRFPFTMTCLYTFSHSTLQTTASVPQAQASSSAQPAATSTTQGWIWSAAHNDYYMYINGNFVWAKSQTSK